MMYDFLKLKKLSSSFVSTTLLLLFFAIASSAFAQQTVQVRGKIIDGATNEEIIGANIIQVGTTNGTTTDINGSFTLNAPANATLRISSIGYATQEVTVPNMQNAQLNIRLLEDAKLLEEVVVVGYGTQKKSEITASVSSLTEENFNTTIASSSALELAQGRIAGLLITANNSGDPRSRTNIQIRGTSSMRGSNAPLIVIDGVPGGDINLIPPEDITSFSVLKDASAAAIYGTRGANGVILITTKRGRSGNDIKSTFEYSGTMSHAYIYRRPEILSADEYRAYMQSGNYNANMMIDYGDDTNWIDLLTNKNNFSHTHNLAMRGGTQTSNYRASIYMRTFDGIAIEQQNKNWGARMNVNHLGLNDRLDVQINMNANFRERNRVGRNDEWEQAAQRNPTEPAKDANGKWLEDAAYNSHNPLARYSTMEDWESRASWMLSQRATLTVVEGLKVALMTSWSQYNETRNQYYEKGSKTSSDSYTGGGRAQKWSTKDIRQIMDLTVDYSKIFNDVHAINTIVGHGYEYYVRETFNAWNSGFITDGFKYNNLGSGTGLTSGNTSYFNMASSKADNKLASFFGRVNYGFNDTYLFSVTLRLDGSSKFGSNHRWGTFPAISGGWVITNEKFMKSVDFVNNLKLRVAYGVTGNMPDDDVDDGLGSIANNLYMTTYSSSNRQLINGVWTPLYGPARNPNPNLKWEEKREFNFGLDFNLLKNRLSGTIDVYRRLTVDIIDNYNAQLPAYVLPTMYANVGTMENKGVEIGLSFKAVNTRDIKWDIAGTFVYQKNILISLSDDIFKATYRTWQGLPSPGALGDAFRTEEGQATGGFYAKRFAGFTDTGQWLFYKKDGTKATLSEMSTEDLCIVGNGNPKVQASLNNTFRYKNWDLTMLMRGKFGFQILNTKEMYFGNRNWFPNNVLKSAITKHADLKDAPQYSDYYLENGNYVKISSLTLGYNFNIKNRTWVRNARVYASLDNVATFTKYSGTNPELRDTGFITGYDARGFMPATSTMMLGVNLGF